VAVAVVEAEDVVLSNLQNHQHAEKVQWPEAGVEDALGAEEEEEDVARKDESQLELMDKPNMSKRKRGKQPENDNKNKKKRPKNKKKKKSNLCELRVEWDVDQSLLCVVAAEVEVEAVDQQKQ